MTYEIKQVEDLLKAFEEIDSIKTENKQLKKQIEKMKCCENCNQIWCDSRQDIQQVEKCIDDDYSLWGIKLKNV